MLMERQRMSPPATIDVGKDYTRDRLRRKVELSADQGFTDQPEPPRDSR